MSNALRSVQKGVLTPIGRKASIDWLFASIISAFYLTTAFIDLRVTLYDDAAITFRYAVNISQGSGFVYNLGDATNGASAPLYALLLALSKMAGLDLESTAKIIGAVSFAAIGFLTYFIGIKFFGRFAAITAVIVLIFIPFFREQIGSGMESALASALGLAALYFLVEKKYLLTGVLTGLSVFNKLDALALFAGIGIAIFIWQRSKFKLFATAFVVTLLPWLLFSTFYFGSPLPFSASQKLQNIFGTETSTKDPNAHYDPSWVLTTLSFSTSIFLVAFAVLGISVILFQVSSKSKVATTKAENNAGKTALLIWFTLHLGLFSLINLGAPYPWYVTVLFPPFALFIGAALFELSELVFSSKNTIKVIVSATLLFSVIFTLSSFVAERTSQLLQVFQQGHFVSDYEDFELTRKQAGIYISKHSAITDVVETCFGWIAYGAISNPIKETCPLSTRLDVGTPTWAVQTFFPDDIPIGYTPPEGWILEETFLPTNGGPGATLVLRAQQ